MRVDADELKSASACAEVYVDGVQSLNCVMADEERGCVEEMVVQDNGRGRTQLVEDPTCPRGVQTRMRWGKVEIRPAPGHEADFAFLKQQSEAG